MQMVLVGLRDRAGAFAKAVAPRLSTWLRANRLLLGKDSYLHRCGWVDSLRDGRPRGPDGSALPWMNYPTIAFLQERLRPDHVVFEYGAGYSTLFFAQRTEKVISVEYDQDWHARIGELAPPNVRLVFCPCDIDGAYCRIVVSEGSDADVVVVDGRDRVNCVRESIVGAGPGRVIILDDSDRPRYKPALDFAKDSGYRMLHLVGPRPGTGLGGQSSILYAPGNCFDL